MTNTRPIGVESGPHVAGPTVDTVVFAGSSVQRARWSVAWPAATSAVSVDHVRRLLPPEFLAPQDAFGSASTAASSAAILNAAALHLALRLHGRLGPEFARFVIDAPQQSDTEGFSFCFIDPFVATSAAASAARTIHRAITSPAASGHSLDDLLQAAGHDHRQLWPSTKVAEILLAAVRRGIPVARMTDFLPAYRLGHGRWQGKLFKGFTHRTPSLATAVTTSKAAATQVLARLGFPVPVNQIVASLDDARRVAGRLGYPVVVKPNAADFGRGVTADIRSDTQLAVAFGLARSFGDVLVEQHIAGENYRLLVVNGVCQFVYHRVQPHVIGDGSRTIAELMLEKVGGHGESKGLLPDDPLVIGFLAGFGRRTSDVPAAGERVKTSAVANVSVGGTRVAVAEPVHPETRQLAESVALALGIDLAGIDLITPDITRSWREVGGAINEVNVNPALPFQQTRDAVLDSMFPAGANGRVEITVVLGGLSPADADVIGRWLTRGRPLGSCVAILGHAALSDGLIQADDFNAIQSAVEQQLGRAELERLVVQTNWKGAGPLLLPVPYQTRLLIAEPFCHQPVVIDRIRGAVDRHPTTVVSAFDAGLFESPE